MADPLSILGAAVGVTSLAIQLAEECVKLYRYYALAADMPPEHRYLQVRLQMEQQRFLNFGTEAGLLLEDGLLSSTLKVNRAILLAVLAEVKGLFEQLVKKSGRYDKIAPSPEVDWNDLSEPETALEALMFDPAQGPPQEIGADGESDRNVAIRHLNKLRKRVVRTGTRLRKVVTEPKRLVWVAFDKEEYEGALGRIGELNSFLTALLDGSQIDRIRQDTAASYHEILQLRNDISSLHGLVKALQTPTDQSSPRIGSSSWSFAETISVETDVDVRRRAFLSKLTEIKIEYTQVDNIAGNSKDDRLARQIAETKDATKKTFPDSFTDMISPRWKSWTQYRQQATYNGDGEARLAWIEWKEGHDTLPLSEPALQVIENRVCLLTYLLSHKMPSDFRAPPVLGYLRSEDDEGNTSFGLILGSPLDAGMGPVVHTLNDLLRSTPKASLSRRMTLCAVLAESVYNFHSVNWLHKGIRSDSVLFFSETGKPADIRAPYLSGFDLSRPNLGTDMSERPAKNPGRDMYRHPETQSFRSSDGYAKAFDVYSLGVVFIEIAFWKPIEKILGFDDPMTLGNSTVSRIRQRLLEGDLAQDIFQTMAGTVPGTATEPVRTTKVLSGIASEGGDAYEEVVELCLRADEIEKPVTPGESTQRAAARLQRVMEMSVVAKLKQVEEALRTN